MDYIYDIVLNFHNDYYEFYEWNSSDKLINVKKIPIYKIETKDYLNIKNNNVIINRNSLSKNNKMFLLTNGIEVMGIIVDNIGKVIKKSSLIFEEADEILEDKDMIIKINIKYKINKYKTNELVSRVVKEKKDYVYMNLNNFNKDQDEYLLKYLYYDIYNKDENSIDKIYQQLLDLSREDINKIYDSLVRVSLELKR